jgi:hypothetical protein
MPVAPGWRRSIKQGTDQDRVSRLGQLNCFFGDVVCRAPSIRSLPDSSPARGERRVCNPFFLCRVRLVDRRIGVGRYGLAPVLDMAAPLSVVTPPNGGNSLPQNPVFVVAGP